MTALTRPGASAVAVDLDRARGGADAVGAPTRVRALYLACDEAFAAISVASILLGLSEARLPFLTRLMRGKLVTSVAALSYAVYLVHWPIIEAIASMLGYPTGPHAFVELAVLASVAVSALAYVLHVAIERPFLRAKDALRDGS